MKKPTSTLALLTALALTACGGDNSDTTKPTVSLDGPANVTSTAPVTFTATASDASGIAKVEFYRGSTLLGTDTTAPYTHAVTFSAVDNGTQTITAKATDTVGNSASATRSTTINISTPDTTPPTVSLTGPVNVTSTAPVTFTATASDASGIAKVEFYRGSTLLGTDTTAPYTQAVTFSPTDNGTQTITAKAVDAAGNSANASHTTNVNISTPAPTVTGTYTGVYTCIQGLTGLRLELAQGAGGQITGTFNFFAVAGNPGVPSGSFTVEGILNGSNLTLTGKTWIDRPTGYLFANLNGQWNANFTTYAGTVSGPPNCTTFNVTKQ